MNGREFSVILIVFFLFLIASLTKGKEVKEDIICSVENIEDDHYGYKYTCANGQIIYISR